MSWLLCATLEWLEKSRRKQAVGGRGLGCSHQALNGRDCRALTQLERLQRQCKGDYVPPPVKVSVDGPLDIAQRGIMCVFLKMFL